MAELGPVLGSEQAAKGPAMPILALNRGIDSACSSCTIRRYCRFGSTLQHSLSGLPMPSPGESGLWDLPVRGLRSRTRTGKVQHIFKRERAGLIADLNGVSH
jgi:hypothetical protein